MKDQSFWRQAWHALIRDTPAFSPSREERRRELARAVFRLSMLVSRIQYPSRTFVIKDMPEGSDGIEFEPSGHRSWAPIRLTWRLFELSQRLDPYHWEHWALVHDDDPSARACLACGGSVTR